MPDSRSILYSAGKNDGCYTPRYAVEPIVKYIKPGSTVWCPFDKEDSEYVRVLQENGFNVVYSHIDYGQDFFEYEPKHWDCIISNPPFSNKRKFFEKALSFDKPFALLMSATWLNDSAPVQLFYNKDLQLLMFDKRVKFLNNGVVDNKITFKSIYYCYNFLPKQIIMERLSECNDRSRD